MLSGTNGLENGVYYIILIGAMFSIVLLFYSIINTHEKTKQKLEADFAKGIIASGEAHYKKMNNLLANLRIMRHDSKYHHRVLMDFLQKDEAAKAIEYLGGVQNDLSKYELESFCDNQAVNALLTWYAGRCKELNIDYIFNADIPVKTAITDYDLCIVIGNLLENALEASQSLKTDRTITLDLMIHNEQFVLKTVNYFDEKAVQIEGDGFGLRSVQLVTEQYGGQFSIKNNGSVFTASVIMTVC